METTTLSLVLKRFEWLLQASCKLFSQIKLDIDFQQTGSESWKIYKKSSLSSIGESAFLSEAIDSDLISLAKWVHKITLAKRQSSSL